MGTDGTHHKEALRGIAGKADVQTLYRGHRKKSQRFMLRDEQKRRIFTIFADGPLNINSTRADFINAYPGNPAIRKLSGSFVLKTSYPNIYYKR